MHAGLDPEFPDRPELRILHPHRSKNILVVQLFYKLPGSTLNDPAQNDVVGMRVLLARARREIHLVVADRVVDQLLVRKGAKRLGQLHFQKIVDGHIVDIAGRVGH